MNKPRKLQQNVWYKVGSEINIGEPLFRLPETKVLLHRVLRETKDRYGFETRGLRLEGARLTFCIKPDDGLQIPLTMQWIKQTFSVRLNARTGRTGHVWGNGMNQRSCGEGRLKGRRKLTGRRWKSRRKRRYRRLLPTPCLGTAPARTG
ncbi:MAG: hypothetical protein LBG27_07410 [Spirochaetaceae bacterium]|nr:hypothetical protein [Spirochaetaceae bacterium]